MICKECIDAARAQLSGEAHEEGSDCQCQTHPENCNCPCQHKPVGSWKGLK
jgi:hypothetical protein